MNPKRPYSIGPNDMLRGPTYQPADISDIPDRDGFVEFLNDVFQLGFEAGFELRGDPDEYEEYERRRFARMRMAEDVDAHTLDRVLREEDP